MLTFTGAHVTKEFGAPNIRDIAVQSMRMVRFSGAAEIFWPVGMHMLLVADLMPRNLNKNQDAEPGDPRLELYALLHDAAEVCVADVPRPMKTDEARAVEDAIQSRIYQALGIPEPSAEIKAAVKHADFRAALAEGTLGCSGRGYVETQTSYRRDEEAEKTLIKYIRAIKPEYECINYQCMLDADGYWPLEYEARVRRALRAAQHSVSYAPADDVAAGNAVVGYEHAVIGKVRKLYATLEHRPSYQAVCAAIHDALAEAPRA